MSEAKEEGDDPQAAAEVEASATEVGAFPTRSAPRRKGSRGRAILNESLNDSFPTLMEEQEEQATAPEDLLVRAREDQQPVSPPPARAGAFPSAAGEGRTKRSSVPSINPNPTALASSRASLRIARGLRNNRGREGGLGPTAQNPHEPHREPQNLVGTERPTAGADRQPTSFRGSSEASARRAYLERKKSGELPSQRILRTRSHELQRPPFIGSREPSARRAHLERKKSGELPNQRLRRTRSYEPRTSIVSAGGSIRMRSSPEAPLLTREDDDDTGNEASQPNRQSGMEATEQDEGQSGTDRNEVGREIDEEDKSFVKTILQLTDSDGENETEEPSRNNADGSSNLQDTSTHTEPVVSTEPDFHLDVDNQDDIIRVSLEDEPSEHRRAGGAIAAHDNPLSDAISIDIEAYVVEETEHNGRDLDEQQQPLIVAATQVDKGKQRRRTMLVAAVALIVGGLVATVAILLASRDSSPNDSKPTISPTSAPTTETAESPSNLPTSPSPQSESTPAPTSSTMTATESPTRNHSNIFDQPSFPTSNNNTEPTVAPTTSFPIPDYTRDALNDASSPQSLALDWLEDHPDYDTMPVWRREQLFALATFGFSTMTTEQVEIWLDHDTAECMWPQPEDGDSTGPNCTNGGQYQVLNFQFRNGRQLEEFQTSRLQGSIPPEISFLSMLHSIELIQQGLVGRMPQQIYQLTKLQILNVRDSGGLSGNFLGHPDIGKLTELKSFAAGVNKLTGTITTEVGLLTKLVSLLLSDNNLQGSLPSELGLLTLLEELYLDKNQLTGSLTSEIGQLSRLKSLSLAHNNMHGLIPEEFIQLTELTEIDLRSNSFAGSIPSEICSGASVDVDCTVECTCQSCTCHDFSPPTYSQNALKDAKSPQSTALAWLEDHPEFSKMEKWRKEQLFALATFAHSTMTTEQAQLWLDHDTEECKWPQPEDSFRNGPDCTDDGMYQALSFTIEDGEQLEVFQSRLKGSIPPEIQLLSMLHTLNVWNQDITGTLPTPEIYSMATIQYLNLGSSGEVSGDFLSQPEVGQMTSLEQLVVGNQSLTGTLATEIGLLSKLFFLGAANNNFHSTLPSELGQLTLLNNLFLGGNQLRGPIPQEYYQLTNLIFLDLNSNDLTGTLSPDVGSLSKLTSLHLEFNNMEGSLPYRSLAKLRDLLDLHLQSNKFSGAIPQTVCSDARDVNVDCNVTCTCRTCICHENLFNPPSYSNSALRNSSSPQSLALAWLSGHPQYDEMPTWRREQLFALATFAYSAMSMEQALMWLDPDTNECEWPQPQRDPDRLGIGPDCTNERQYQSLSFRIEEGWERLEMFQTKLQGSIPPEVALLPSLKTLNFWGQPISGEIPHQLTMLTKLEYINMGTASELSGDLLSSPDISQLTKLVSLWLGDHSLTGTLASELGTLPKLTVLHAGSNKLKGSLPSELGQLTKLTQLHLHRNEFTGPIPTEYYGLTNLIFFELAYNELTGPVMPELGQLSKLTSLHLESNKLEGALPEEMRQLTNLLGLHLQYNTFSGTIPDTVCLEVPSNVDCSVVCRCDKCECFTWQGLECTCAGRR